MTDPTPRPDDELVSAVLDGEATADEQARVEADPDARQRLAELRAVRDLVAAPVTVPDAARQQAMAAALAEFDALAESADAAPTGAGPAPNDELAARRARRGSGGRGGRFLAAAAAVVVLVLGVGAVVRALNPSSNETLATSSDSSAQRESPAVAGSAGGGPVTNQAETGAVATTSTVPSTAPAPTTTVSDAASAPDVRAYAVATVDLGVVGTPAELRDRMLGAVDERQESGPPPTGFNDLSTDQAAFVSCGDLLDAIDPELDQLLALGTATYQGQQAAVYAFSIDRVTYPAANGSVRLYAVDPATCSILSVQTVR